jgi:hypothetical protein
MIMRLMMSIFCMSQSFQLAHLISSDIDLAKATNCLPGRYHAAASLASSPLKAYTVPSAQ